MLLHFFFSITSDNMSLKFFGYHRFLHAFSFSLAGTHGRNLELIRAYLNTLYVESKGRPRKYIKIGRMGERWRKRALPGRPGWKQKGITFIDFIYSCWDYTCVVIFPYDVASL